MTESMRRLLLDKIRLTPDRLEAINTALLDPGGRLMPDLLDVVLKYGSPEEINRQAQAAAALPQLINHVRRVRPEYLVDLDWLRQCCQERAFIRIDDYRRSVLGDRYSSVRFDHGFPVTLEISACQYFPWLMDIARRAVERGEIMPARFIRVRNMQEQEADGDLPAFAAGMQIIGASYVEQPDTRGSDGSNIHLGGPDTLIGYYGGVGQPNRHPLQWLDECLYYYTRYGVSQVLNVNPGRVLVGYLLHRLGVDIEFKISVTLGNDNPYSAFWTLLTAHLFARPDGSIPLVGFNWSNSTDTETIEIAARYRKTLGLEDLVRFEHHVTETWKGLVIQPYNRREAVVELAERVANLSAKHEGGDPEVEAIRVRPSEIQDYYRLKSEIITSGDWDSLTLNFMDKFDSLNRTARALTERGLAFLAARNLHHA